jgi:preprotein translocase subunit SecA
MVEKLQEKEDYEIDEKKKASTLTDAGITKIEKLLNIPNIYDTSKGVATIHHIEQALRAKTLFKKDRDYVVREDEIVIVDEFTGRLMFGRRYSQGLHQAIEAKEGVKIQAESKTLATITFQNLFRLYFRLAGMTGTAKTEEEEFFKIYKLTVDQIPTNKPMVRNDQADLVYKTEEAKFSAIAKEVKARHKNGQPVLIGTVSVAKNELLAEVLKKEGVPFEVLNAKNHEREAHIVAQAGRLGAVTLATNIAGRGVDILLGGNPIDKQEAEAVKESGGLHVLGTERHESRRIDNQLRGRSGRQGDPGSSQFFVSMEDDLMRLFGGDRMKNLMTSLGLPDDQPIEAKLVSRSIEQAQKKIEGLNFDTRKHVLEFDDVLNSQRNAIYKRRRGFVAGTNESETTDLKKEVLDAVKKEIEDLVTFEFSEKTEGSNEPLTSINNILQQTNTILPVSEELKRRIIDATQNAADKEFAVIDEITKDAEKLLDEKEKQMGGEIFQGALRFVALSSLDELWMEHLDSMDHLRDSVRLRGYGQRDPLIEYKREGHQMFQRMLKEINRQIAHLIYKVNIQVEPQAKPVQTVTNQPGAKGSVPSTDPKYEGVGRNDLCPCGSGKKFKRCHGK